MRWTELLAGAAFVIAGVACGTVHGPEASDRAASSAAASAPAAALEAPLIADAGPDAAPPDAAAPVPERSVALAEPEPPQKKRTGDLARFFTALDGLERRTRKEHVRVLWLGDSHGQADFWSGKLRTALQKRFGNGGPGFVHVAYRGYRHDGVEVGMTHKWRTTPRGPSTSVPSGDGMFGLGGLLTTAKEPGSEATIEVQDSSLPKKLRWDLCYRFDKPDESITMMLPGIAPVTLTPAAGAPLPEHPPLLHVTFNTDVPVQVAAPKNKGPRLTVSSAAGYPSYCGAVIETDPLESPGVVLDSLGINGARFTTALAWDEAAWLAELSRRSPSLVIFEYGTNEAGDVGVKAETYAEKVTKLVARIHKIKADADCLVLAPTERADQEERSARIRDIWREAARANQCMFWDTIEVMGGRGSMRQWRDENPARGAKDGIHLTVRGYYELGERLAQDILHKY